MRSIFLFICLVVFVAGATAQLNNIRRNTIQQLRIDTVKEWMIHIDSAGNRTDSSYIQYCYDSSGYLSTTNYQHLNEWYNRNNEVGQSVALLTYTFGLLFIENEKKYVFFENRDKKWSYFRRGLSFVELFVEKDRRRNTWRRVLGKKLPAYALDEVNGQLKTLFRFEYHFR